MLLAIGIVGLLGGGGFLLSRSHKTAVAAPPPPPPPPAAPPPGPRTGGTSLTTPKQPISGGTLDVKLLTTGASVAGTAATAIAAAGGISVGIVAAWAAAIAAIVGFALLSGFALAGELTNLATGRKGYKAAMLMSVVTKVSAEMLKGFVDRGASMFQARAAANLYGFYEAVGYNRAALAFVLKGGNPNDPQQAGNVGYWADRGQCVEEAGGIFSKSPAWVPPPPLFNGIAWPPEPNSLEYTVFGAGGAAQAKADAGNFWNPLFEATADFSGRALRCTYALQTHAGGSDWGLNFDFDGGLTTVGLYVNYGMIGNSMGRPQDCIEHGDRVVDRALVILPTKPQIGTGLAWFFLGSEQNPATAKRDSLGNVLGPVRPNL
jgi:hypothetical protein